MVTDVSVRTKSFVINSGDPMPTAADGAMNGSLCKKVDADNNSVEWYCYSQSNDTWVSYVPR